MVLDEDRPRRRVSDQRVRLWFLYFAVLGSPETDKANNKSLALQGLHLDIH